MEFFGRETKIDFMGCRRWAGMISIVLCTASIIILLAKGLNWGLEFTGGTEAQLHFSHQADIPQIQDKLAEAGFKDIVVQTYGTTDTVMAHFAGKQNLKTETLSGEIQQLFPDAAVAKVDYIGAQVGKELAFNGALALVVAMLGTAVYIAFRFEYRFAVSAAVALLHDPIIILGVFAWFQLKFDLVSLAAILTIIGYSLNDTIVVFDRVRENFRRSRKGTTEEIMNLSVNQTLSRTIMTSGLTLLSVIALFIFGGEVLRGFSLALIIGIIVGTYSSIYIAGTLAVLMGLSREDLLPAAKEVDDRP